MMTTPTTRPATEISDYRGRTVHLQVDRDASQDDPDNSTQVLRITHPGGLLILNSEGLDALGSFVSGNAAALGFTVQPPAVPQEESEKASTEKPDPEGEQEKGSAQQEPLKKKLKKELRTSAEYDDQGSNN